MKFMIIHADQYFELYEKNPLWYIKQQWRRWKRLYEIEYSMTKDKNIVNQIQAWHALCALTTILNDRNEFDAELNKVKD